MNLFIQICFLFKIIICQILYSIQNIEDNKEYFIQIKALEGQQLDQPYNDIQQQFTLFSLKETTLSDIAIISNKCLIDNLPTDQNISLQQYLSFYPEICLKQQIYIYTFSQEQLKIILQELLYQDKCIKQNEEQMRIVGVWLKVNKYCELQQVKICKWQLSSNFQCNLFLEDKQSVSVAVGGYFNEMLKDITSKLLDFNQNQILQANTTFYNILSKSFQQHRDGVFQQTNSGRNEYKLNNNYIFIYGLFLILCLCILYWKKCVKQTQEKQEQYDYFVNRQIQARRQILFSILN